MSNSTNIAGKVVVITGASSGRGEAIPADSFARMGAFAVGQPEEVDVDKILFRPTRQNL